MKTMNELIIFLIDKGIDKYNEEDLIYCGEDGWVYYPSHDHLI